jgi:hypothetical protein
MSRFIFTRLAQLVLLSAALLSTTTKTHAGVAGCPGGLCNADSGQTCCNPPASCCTVTGHPYCSGPANCM